MDTALKTERVSLSRDLSEFLVELSITLQKHAMYPDGHPSLTAATAALLRRAAILLEDRPALVFGVARRQLIIDGVATDPDQPVLRRLAEALHQHHLGAISLMRGLEVDEIAQALRALSAEAAREGPLGLATTRKPLEWPHLRLHPITFDRLALTRTSDDPDGNKGGGNTRATELWVGLARAAMATEKPIESDNSVPEPAVVAHAIDEHHDAAAYDQVIVGYMLQIATELKGASGEEAAALRKRTSRLIGSMKPETLRRLVEMGGSAAQRRDFVLNAASGMAVDAVVDIVKAAAEASGQTISHGLVRMLTKLAVHAEHAHQQTRPMADDALRDQVARLLDNWELEDPNPDEYGKALHRLATASKTSKSSAPKGDVQDPIRIIQMCLEVGEIGPLVDRALERLLETGQASAVLEMMAAAPHESRGAAEMVKVRMAAPSTLARLMSHEPIDFDTLDHLFPLIALEGYEVLLDTLATSKNRSTRRKLLDRLAQAAIDIGPLISARLEDERWYVVRNMLVLLRRSKKIPAGYSSVRWTQHPDHRVRYEAIQLRMQIPAERNLAVKAALEDTDLRLVRIGLTGLQHQCPATLTPLVAGIALNNQMEEELRVLAVRALGHSKDPSARDALLQLVDGGRTFLGRPRLAATDICVPAIHALAQGWHHDPAAAPMLKLARLR